MIGSNYNAVNGYNNIKAYFSYQAWPQEMVLCAARLSVIVSVYSIYGNSCF